MWRGQSDRGNTQGDLVADSTIQHGTERNFGHMLPGIVSWTLIVFAVLGTFLFPRAWLVFATLFMGYMVVRGVITFGFALYGERQRQHALLQDWTLAEDETGPFGFAPAETRHVIIIPNYKEPIDILRRTLDGLAAQHRAAERIIPVLGMEEREADARAKGEALAAEYAGRFLNVIVTVHPAGLPGDEPGKSSNEAWAAKEAHKVLLATGVDLEVTTITSCDADSVLHPKYFSAVATMFAADEQRHLSFWQAPLCYYNNIWHVPAPIRFTTWLSHTMQMAELAMPFYQPLPISTYTLSIKLAERCGWWDPSVISEDWHSFLNCLFESGEEISTVSVFLPTMGDATDGDGWADAMSNRFHQVKRHAWGAEDVGYITGQLSLKPGALRGSTTFRLGQVLHDHVLRVATWFILASIYAISSRYATMHWYSPGWHSGIAQNLAVLRVLLGVGGLTIASTIVFELWRCPPPDSVSRAKTAVEIGAMWFTMMFLGFYLGTLPALEAQTRLLFGIPLGYKVTPKKLVPAAQTSKI